MDIEGKRILVVEDDYYLAREMRDMLEHNGARVVGPAPTAFYGQSLLGRRGVDFAVLDIRLHGGTVYELADDLNHRRTPYIFATALSREQILPAYRSVPVVQKPCPIASILEIIRQHEKIGELEPEVLQRTDEKDPAIRLMRAIRKAMKDRRTS